MLSQSYALKTPSPPSAAASIAAPAILSFRHLAAGHCRLAIDSVAFPMTDRLARSHVHDGHFWTCPTPRCLLLSEEGDPARALAMLERETASLGADCIDVLRKLVEQELHEQVSRRLRRRSPIVSMASCFNWCLDSCDLYARDVLAS